MNLVRTLLVAATLSFLSLFLFIYSCSDKISRGDSSPAPIPTSAVRLSFTADGMPTATGMLTTVETVKIANVTTGEECELLTVPVTLNLTDLANMMQIVSIQKCAAGLYTIMHVEFDKSISLITAATSTVPAAVSLCSFESSLEGASQASVDADSTYSLDFPVNVSIPETSGKKITLNFNLSSFDVTKASDPATCAVPCTMDTLRASETAGTRTYPENVTGLITDVTATNRTFSFVRGSLVCTADYSKIAADQQPGLDELLLSAETASFRVKVMSADLGMLDGTVTASNVYVKMQGVVSGLDAAAGTFTVTVAGSDTYTIDCGSAEVNGLLTDGAWAMIRLYGSDGTRYLASRVDVCASDMTADS